MAVKQNEKSRPWPLRRCSSASRAAWGTTLLRLVLGGTFLAHGIQKAVLWGWEGGAPFFAEVGIPLPWLAAPLVTAVETLGGALLLLGVATRGVAAVLALVMLVAGVTVHLPHGFFAPAGVELVLVLGSGLMVLVLQGPGRLALRRFGLTSVRKGIDAGPGARHHVEMKRLGLPSAQQPGPVADAVAYYDA